MYKSNGKFKATKKSTPTPKQKATKQLKAVKATIRRRKRR